jgi:predicted ATP-grasp superfamily ATP-dependent carboligase
MSDRPSLIVVGYSARALASSAKRAGFAPLAIDVFGDDDTREISLATITLEGGLSNGLTETAVADAIETLIRAHNPIGLVYGSGFEHQPGLITVVSRETRIFGNNSRSLARAKDPVLLAQICASAGVPYPQIALAAPDEPEGWLMKRRGGAGGSHIRAATRDAEVPSEFYFQREVRGDNISALFISDGIDASIFGLSAQWTAPTSRSPFRYGGAAGPVNVDVARAEDIERAVRLLTRELALVGLNSADFLVSGELAWFVEINPRPGATLDVFDSDEDALIGRHVAACDGRTTAPAVTTAGKAAQIVYATCGARSPFKWRWPDWTADRPARGTRINVGDPVCTVLASAASVGAARRLADERARQIDALVQESTR